MTASGGDSKASSATDRAADTWVARNVRQRTLRLSVASLVAILAVVAALWTQRRYVVNFVNGPYPAGAAELDRIGDISVEPRYFVRVTGTEVSDTGVIQVAIRKYKTLEIREGTVANYYALQIGDRALLCRGSPGSGPTFEGRLLTTPPSLAALVGTRAGNGLGPRFYPFYLDDSFREIGYVAIFGLFIFLCLLGWYALGPWWWLNTPTNIPCSGASAVGAIQPACPLTQNSKRARRASRVTMAGS